MLRIGALLAAAVLFAGCATPLPEPVAQEPVDVVVEPPPIKPQPKPQVAKPVPLPPIAIVLANSQPAYADVAQELTQHLENYEIYDLSDTSRVPVSVLKLINDSDSDAVVAIGLRAAVSSVAMSENPVIFSQVFNYRHHRLLKNNSRGVAVLPPVDAQIAAWKDIDPAIGRIGVIVGQGHDDLVTDAEIAARRHGIELRVKIARSDQETLYFFRRMIRDIDAFWLLPDNRILSKRVLEQMLADAKRQGVPVSVPNESMLSLGAGISMTSQAADIAKTIVKVLRKIQAGKIDSIPPLTQLSEIRVKSNRGAQVVSR